MTSTTTSTETVRTIQTATIDRVVNEALTAMGSDAKQEEVKFEVSRRLCADGFLYTEIVLATPAIINSIEGY